MDRENVIKGLEICTSPGTKGCVYDMYESTIECPYAHHGCRVQMENDALALLKEQELPTELKQKMWNALYAEEDKYEKKFVGKEEHLNWFTVYRPWLQKGFDIAINAIADWEGR